MSPQSACSEQAIVIAKSLGDGTYNTTSVSGKTNEANGEMVWRPVPALCSQVDSLLGESQRGISDGSLRSLL